MELSQSEKVKWFKRILPVFIGAAGGYAYYHFIGCTSGVCPISSNPYISTAYGGFIGALFISHRKKNAHEKEVNQ
jgi:hypothetical protein